MKWKTIKDWLQTIALIGMIVWFAVIQINKQHSDTTVPTAWTKAPKKCIVEGTTGIKKECLEFLPKMDDKTGVYYQKIANLGPCELYRTRYRGIYYIVNSCGGIVVEPTGD